MSRYNHWWCEVTKAARALFIWIVITPVFLSLFVSVAIVHDTEEARARCDRLLCRLTEHQWADDTKWGVESVCLNCGASREVADGD